MTQGTDDNLDALRKRVARLRELADLKRKKPVQFWRPHSHGQLQFHRAPHIIRALFPGNGFGKTRAAGSEVAWWLFHSHPYQKVPKWPLIIIWCAETYKQFEILREQLESECFGPRRSFDHPAGWTFNSQKNAYTFGNGDRLFLISGDGSWTHVQGINPDLVVFDEEPPAKLWNEMKMRRRGRRKTRYVFAATATQGLTWMHKEIYTSWLKHHSDEAVGELDAMTVQSHPMIWCWPLGGIDDNPGADAGDRAYYHAQTFASAAEKGVRLRGGFADFAGQPVFNHDALDELRLGIEPGVSGTLTPTLGDDGEPIGTRKDDGSILPELFTFLPEGEQEGGRVTIWRHPDLNRTRYVIGFDSAYGLVTGDLDYAVVLDLETGEQVAEAAGHWGDQHWAETLHALYHYYGQAFICGERQVGLITMRRLYDEMGVGYMYYDRDEEKRSRRRSDTLGHNRRAGDLVIRKLRVAIAPHDAHQRRLPSQLIVRSAELLRQMFKYQFRSTRESVDIHEAHDAEIAMGAPRGDHDDGVMALVYANLARLEIEKFEPPAPKYEPGTYGHLLKTPAQLDAEDAEKKRKVDPFSFD